MKPVIRCSSLDQLLSCPGSRTLIERVSTKDTSGPAAWSGNWCHWDAAKILCENFGAVSPQPLPEWPTGVPRDYKPSSFDRWVVGYYLNQVLAYTREDMAIEVENEMAYDVGPCILSGHADYLAITPDARESLGADLKRGFNVVDPAASNWQVSGYFVLTKRSYPRLERSRYALIQPALPEDAGFERVTWAECNGEELEKLEAYLADRIADALRRPMELESGPKQCAYCPAYSQCPCLRKEIEFMKHSLTKEELERVQAEAGNDQLAYWWVARKMLGGLMDKAADTFKERVEAAGGNLTIDANTFTLVPRKGRREIEAKPGWEKCCDLFDEARAYECLTLSAASIEEKLAEQFDLPKTSKKGQSAKSKFDEEFAAITTQKESKQIIMS